ncbi:hypothetical protein ACFL0W_06755 [Nanoarchaeota archaeon]
MVKEKLDLSISWFKQVLIIIFAGLVFGIVMGGFFAIFMMLVWGVSKGLLYGLFAGLVSGLLFGILIGLFSFSVSNTDVSVKSVFADMKLHKDEKIIAVTNANYIQNKIAHGGKLLITNKGLRFVQHHFNFSSDSLFIRYSRIKDVFKTKMSLSELFGGSLVPRLCVLTKDGTKNLFVIIFNMKKIIDFIDNKI